MKTIKIIDLLNMIANREAPKNIKYKEEEYYLFDSCNYLKNDKTRFFDEIRFKELNEEVEIIEEEKEIKMCNVLEHCIDFSENENILLDNQLRLQDKINELIDAVNGIRKEK